MSQIDIKVLRGPFVDNFRLADQPGVGTILLLPYPQTTNLHRFKPEGPQRILESSDSWIAYRLLDQLACLLCEWALAQARILISTVPVRTEVPILRATEVENLD